MLAIATFSLVAGMLDDLRSRKVHNILVLAMLPIILVANFYFRGLEGMTVGVSAFLLALIATIPLFMFSVIGGGDVKLFAAFALCVDPSSMFHTLLYSILWGALFGVSRAMMQNKLLSLVRATYRAGHRLTERSGPPRPMRQRMLPPEEIYKIPYTFALLLGWFTQLTLMRSGGLF